MTALDMFPETQLAPEKQQDERYTTPGTLALCKRLADVEEFDLDVAACLESHCARRYFTREQDGLKGRWRGRVWCNPPFSEIGPWVAKAWKEHLSGRTECIAMLLPANRTEQPWWQEYVEPLRDGQMGAFTTHFLPGRVKFGFPGNPEGKGVGSPPFGCVLLVWRRP